MPRLRRLLKRVKFKNRPEDLNKDIQYLSCFSKDIKPKSLFVAVDGKSASGHEYIQEAISKGASAVVCQRKFKNPRSVSKIIVDDSRKTLSLLAKNFYETNLKKSTLIGITGTNGKTTTSILIENIFLQHKKKTALIGTLGHRINGLGLKKLANTTPGALELHRLLKKTKKTKGDYIIMEVSSHALSQSRVNGLEFDIAVFTNLSQDHLDYHKNMEGYYKAKTKLFRGLSRGSLAVINKDDRLFNDLKNITKARVISYGIKNKADFVAQNIRLNLNHNLFRLKTPSGNISINSKLLGHHNIYNILAASAVGYSQGIDLQDIKEAMEKVIRIPGRLQEIKEGQSFKVFIDYAHTPDALKNILKYLSEVSKPLDRIITVFGCGGDRDKTKRPKMARVCKKYSDFVIVTSDNPRSEDPKNIFKDIKAGFNAHQLEKTRFIFDRQEAIKEALNLAKDNDIVLIAGKGHENKQIFKDKVVAFDDSKVAKKILKAKAKF